MKTPDTEWEKLKKEFIEELKLGKRGHFFRENPDGSVYILAYAGEFIDKLFSSRDTYWKERVRKEVEGMKTDEPLYVGKTQYEFYKGNIRWVANQALDTLLENLNKGE